MVKNIYNDNEHKALSKGMCPQLLAECSTDSCVVCSTALRCLRTATSGTCQWATLPQTTPLSRKLSGSTRNRTAVSINYNTDTSYYISLIHDRYSLGKPTKQQSSGDNCVQKSLVRAFIGLFVSAFMWSIFYVCKWFHARLFISISDRHSLTP